VFLRNGINDASCISGSCRCPTGYSYTGNTCKKEAFVLVEGMEIDENYRPEYADPTSQEFVTFAARFERLMKDFIQFVLGIQINGIQVTELREGSVQVSFLVFNDPSSSGVNSSALSAKLSDPASGVTSITGLNVNTSKSINAQATNPCRLLQPCDEDEQCVVTGDGIEDYMCQCKKDAYGKCKKEVAKNWLIAVIIVSILIVFLTILIIITLVRMYRKRRNRYNFMVGNDNRNLVAE